MMMTKTNFETEACLVADSKSGFCKGRARGNLLKMWLAYGLWLINETRL